MHKKLSFFGVFLSIILLFFTSIALADTNGIWHYAKDVRGGVFGSDEDVGHRNYIFPQNLTVNHTLDVEDNLIVGNRIGIGITSPQEKLDIDGNARFSGNILSDSASINNAIINNVNVSNRIIANLGNINRLGIGTQPVPGVNLDVVGNVRTSGNIYLSGTNKIVGSENLAESINFSNNRVSIRTNNLDRITVLNNGNVGIGTSSPIRRLDVVGNTHVSGFFSATNSYVSNTMYTNRICISGNCVDSLSGITPEIDYPINVRTGSYDGTWTTVHDRSVTCSGNCQQNFWVFLDSEKPILAVRLSGDSRRGAICTAHFGNKFAAAVSKRGAIDYKDDWGFGLSLNGGWTGHAWDSKTGSMSTGTFDFVNNRVTHGGTGTDFSYGIWSMRRDCTTDYDDGGGWYGTTTCTIAKKRGYYTGNSRRIEGVFYHKPYEIKDHIPPNQVLKINHWKAYGGHVDCKVEVMYGDYK